MNRIFHPFPSIGSFKYSINAIRNKNTRIFTFTGTVKLHGTNASIVGIFDDNNVCIDIYCQSRNNVLSLTKDNAGFTRFIENLSNKQELFKPFLEVGKHQTIIIHGEFCGGSIQKGIALNQLPKMFVAFTVSFLDRSNGNDYKRYDNRQTYISNIFYDYRF